MANKNLILYIVMGIAVILFVAGAYYFGDNYGSKGGESGSGIASTGEQAISEFQKDSDGNVIIDVKDFSFNPAEVVLYAGQSVKWINRDDATHQVYGNSKNAENIRSQEMKLGSYYVYNFEKAGTYEYHCTFHPSMKGTIIAK